MASAHLNHPLLCSGVIGARLSVDAATVRSLVGDNLALMVQNLSTVIAGFLIAIIANWELSLVIIVVIPLVGLQGYAQIKFLKGFSADAKVITSCVVFLQSLQGIILRIQDCRRCMNKQVKWQAMRSAASARWHPFLQRRG